jgi:hypothetical protein
MSELSDTFSVFFSDWTEEDAATELKYAAELKADVDKALAAQDWKQLKKLGFVLTSYRDNPAVDAEDQGATLYRKEFNQQKYNDLVADLALTPQQLADRHNARLSW